MIQAGDDYQLVLKKGKKRSLPANAQAHVWIKQVSEVTGEDIKTVTQRVKRDFGLPILLADDEHGQMTGWILEQLNFYNRSDKTQLMLTDALEVTRKFSTAQHNELRDNMQEYYRTVGIELNYLG